MGSFCRFAGSAEAGSTVEPRNAKRSKGAEPWLPGKTPLAGKAPCTKGAANWVRFAKFRRRECKRQTLRRGQVTGSLEGDYGTETAEKRRVDGIWLGGNTESRDQTW